MNQDIGSRLCDPLLTWCSDLHLVGGGPRMASILAVIEEEVSSSQSVAGHEKGLLLLLECSI